MKTVFTSEKNIPQLFLFGNAYLLAYFILSVVFYKERIFLDGSYYFFHVVQREMFHVEHQRFILAVSQLLPVMGARLGLSLNLNLMLSSVNPVLYLWVLFLLSIFWLKNEGVGWALLLSSVCGIYFIWFCPMYEVWYGCVLLIFFAGVLYAKKYSTPMHLLILAVLLITLLFSYPLIFIGVIYFTLAHFIREKKIPLQVMLIYAVVFVIWLCWKFFFISDYEKGKVEYPLSQEGSILTQNFGSVKNLWLAVSFFFSTYLVEMTFLIAAVIGLFMKKEKLQAWLLLITAVGFMLLISFFNIQPWKHSNYFERMYLLLVPLSIVPFTLYIFPIVRQAWFFRSCFILVLLLEGFDILQHTKEYTAHVNQVEALVEKAQQETGSKFTVDFAKHPELASLDEWSLPMECLLFSSLKNNSHTVTVSWKADVENPDISKKLDEEKFRLRIDEIFADDWLNQKFFHLTSGNYHELTW